MYVNHVVEMPDGSLKFQGTLEGPELAIVVEAGLNILLQQGVLPMVSKESFNDADYHQPPDYDQ